MQRKYFLKDPLRRAKLARIFAKLIDLAIVLFLSVALYPVGLLLGAIYLGLADSYKDGRSFGKKLMGFRVISLSDGTPCNFKQAVIRNLPFILPLVVAFFIPFWGLFIGAILSVGMVGFEVYVIVKLDSGHRLGDIMADTSVVSNTPDLVTAPKTGGWFPSEQNPV